MKIQSQFKIFWLGLAWNGHVHSSHGTLKVTASQDRINGINWFLACCYKFTKAKLKLIQYVLGGCGENWARLGHGHCTKNEVFH